MRQLDGITDSMDIEFEQPPGAGDGQGSLACCSPWRCKESDTTERLTHNCIYTQSTGICIMAKNGAINELMEKVNLFLL